MAKFRHSLKAVLEWPLKCVTFYPVEKLGLLVAGDFKMEPTTRWFGLDILLRDLKHKADAGTVPKRALILEIIYQTSQAHTAQ